MGAAYVTGERDEVQLAASHRTAAARLAAFAGRCARAGVRSLTIEDEGDPPTRLRAHAERFDLVVLGQETQFRYETQSGPCDTLDQYLHRPPRPVVAVPAQLPAGEAVVVAYDGSPEAARALAAFTATGIGENAPTVVVTIGDGADATHTAGRAVEYLHRHGVRASAKPIPAGGRVGPRLLEEAAEVDAQLLVMGAFGHSALHEFFFGSTTRRVLGASPVPVFLYH
jgi:nucleotide-binding universal stress UspA family protein